MSGSCWLAQAGLRAAVSLCHSTWNARRNLSVLLGRCCFKEGDVAPAVVLSVVRASSTPCICMLAMDICAGDTKVFCFISILDTSSLSPLD